MDNPDLCGIDVSAKELVVRVRREGLTEAERTFANTASGHEQLRRYVTRNRTAIRVCLESTGLYGLDIAILLQADTRIEVMTANPRAVKDFSRALMHRSKTDPMDALVLVEYAARMPYHPWQPPRQGVLQLTALARRIHALTEQATMEKNRLHAVSGTHTTLAVITRDLRRSITSIEAAIAKLTHAAHKLIASDELLRLRFELLQSVPGIGKVSALQLLGELSMVPADCDVRQWVAYAGLDPRQHQSGSSVQKKVGISKVGNRHIRRALFLPALSACTHNPHIKAFYARLQNDGKCKMVALIAAMRKMLHAIYGMFKHKLPFQGEKLFAASPTKPA